jgi:signal-transduction protein with cAMP-binding, CBS, and nucleotidyltransferase domain
MDRTSGKEQSLVRATASDLRRHAPFDRMDNDHLVFLASRLSLAYYPAQSLILDPRTGFPPVFQIKQGGVIGGGNSEPATGNLHWRLAAGECFPLGALIGDRSVTSYFRAIEDTFCYQLPAEDSVDCCNRARYSTISARAGWQHCSSVRARACRANSCWAQAGNRSTHRLPT